MDSQVLRNIKELQDRENELIKDYPNLGTPELKRERLKDMERLTKTRIELFNSLKSQYSRDVAESTGELEDQLATLHIVENELGHAKQRLHKMNQEYIDKMRMVEISTFFSDKYKSYNDLFKLIIMWMIPIGILMYIGNINPISENYVSKDNSNTIFLVLILVVGFIALYQILNMVYDLTGRNNMNFNEYDFGGSFSYDKMVEQNEPLPGTNGGQGVMSHDVQAFEDIAKSLNLGCVDSYCCADGTIYDSVKKQCAPIIQTHIANSKKAALAKGSMSGTTEQNQTSSGATNNVEAFSEENVPFSSV